jgi:PST family polysaccharide transporter
MLALLALNFVALPVTEVRWCRMLRGQRMKTLAGISAAQVLFDNVLTVALALSGFGVWAVVLPKLLTTPVFVWLIWRAEPWQRAAVAPLPWREVAGFAAPVFAIEVLNALRQHADKLIVGAMLGIELLGVYAFAFNAGLGLGMALTTALTVSLFPHFAVATSGVDRLARFDRALLTACAPVAAILLLQALAALVYVPVVFGERWAFAAPLVALLCASAILRPFADAACQLLRARGDPHLELIAQTAVTALVLTMFTMGLTRDLTTALVCFTIANVAAQATLTLIVRVYAGRPSSGAVGVPA